MHGGAGHDEHFAYKRALSRLLEMTSESYGRDDAWAPLPASARRCEAAPHSRGLALPAVPPERSRPPVPEGDNFAKEVACAGPAPRGARPAAPRLREHPVWGVRKDWGARAGEWGRGSKGRLDSHGEGR